MLPASRAAWVPVFIATPTSAWASAGASLVPSPVIATRRPSACCSRISSSLRSGVASARKSSTPASSAIFAAVRRLSPVTITVRMPIARRWSKRSAHALLDGVLEVDDAEDLAVARDRERRAALAGDPVETSLAARAARCPPSRLDEAHDRVAGALAQPVAVVVDAAHARLRGEGHEVRLVAGELRARGCRTAWRARRSSGPRASRRPARRAARPPPARPRSTPGIGMNSAACAVAERDRAGLVEQQHVDVAGGLDRAAGEREHVAAHEPVHAGDADRAQQRADRRRDQRDEQRDQRRDRDVGVRRTARTGRSDDDDQQEDQRQRRRAGCSARSRSASCGARRPRRARSCGRGTTGPAPA